MTGLHPILLVEDNPHDVELTLAALDKSAIVSEVVVARDGAEALDWILRRGRHADRNDTDPSVILLDIKLPKVDGIDVLAQVKGHRDYRHLPIVMLTGSGEEQDLVRCYELGVNAFVVKPVDYKAFHKAVRDLGVFWTVLNERHPPMRQHPMKVTPA